MKAESVWLVPRRPPSLQGRRAGLQFVASATGHKRVYNVQCAVSCCLTGKSRSWPTFSKARKMFDHASELTRLRSIDSQPTTTGELGIPEDGLMTLMKAAQAGDQDAYVQLLLEVTPRLRRIVLRNRGFLSTEDIEDLVQDILLSLHAVRATYDPRRPFMPWLLAIVRNRLADGARRYARTAAREVATDRLDVTFAAETANITAEA
jgi:hypothetical protein